MKGNKRDFSRPKGAPSRVGKGKGRPQPGGELDACILPRGGVKAFFRREEGRVRGWSPLREELSRAEGENPALKEKKVQIGSTLDTRRGHTSE